MKFHSLRNFLAAVMTLGAAALLSACGGGGAEGNPNQGGPISISPIGDNVTFYAGIPATFTLSGGRPPYAMTSSDASILPVPAIVHGHQATVVPNNPGVIDSGLQPGELPVRSVTVTVRDSTGILTSTTVRVAQNFLTGYGLSFTPSNCPQGSSTAFDPTAQACAGGETAVRMQATFNGSLAGNRQFRLEVIRGNYSLRNPATGQNAQSVLLTSDHSGTVTAIIEVPANVPTQLAVIRVVDVATGVYADHVFTISGFSQSQNLTAIPNEFSFKAALSTRCGTGSADFMVFDGVAPYTATPMNPNLSVTPTVSNTNPGRFTVSAFNPNICLDNATVIITDARGGRTTITVDTLAGDIEPETPPTLTLGPTSITLGCGQTGSIAVVGGTGTYFATSTNPNVSVAISGNVVSITRAGPAGPGTGGTTSVGIAVSDGRAIVTATATVPVSCP